MYPYTKIAAEIVGREGDRYTDHPADLGGPTKFGITLRTLRSLKPWATEHDVQRLTRDEAIDIYVTLYVRPFERFAEDYALLALCADSAVQHGVERVQGWLRAIPSVDRDENYAGLLKRRIQFYGEIITSNPSQAVFAKGWLRRISEFVR